MESFIFQAIENQNTSFFLKTTFQNTLQAISVSLLRCKNSNEYLSEAKIQSLFVCALDQNLEIYHLNYEGCVQCLRKFVALFASTKRILYQICHHFAINHLQCFPDSNAMQFINAMSTSNTEQDVYCTFQIHDLSLDPI